MTNQDGNGQNPDRALVAPHLGTGAPIGRAVLQQQQAAAAKAVTTVLDRLGREFETAGTLAGLLAALPADTPVHVAETVHVDPGVLNPGLTPGTSTVTATVARAVNLLKEGLVDVVEDDGTIRTYGRMVPGIELGAVIVAEGRPVPEKTIPYPQFERALHALGLGDVDNTLAAYARLLREVAEVLIDTPAGPDGTPETVPSWLPEADTDLREQLTIEGDRLRHSAGRLDALAQRIADREAQRDAADDPEYVRRMAELREAPADGYPPSWVTNGVPQFDNRIDDLAARDAYIADGHADENDDTR